MYVCLIRGGERCTKIDTHIEIQMKRERERESEREEKREVIIVPKSTTKNSKFEQEQYHEQIRNFAREWFNIYIPLPNEEIFINS